MFERFKAEKRLSEIEERVERLERASKQIKLEWDDAYERLTKMQQRIVKRAEVVERAERQEAEEAAEIEGVEPTDLLHLTPHQRTIQAKILATRGNRNGILPR